MPGFDGTGPMGAGPMTGGARGYCEGYGPTAQPFYGRGPGLGRGYGYGRGYGSGFGRGRGYGRGYGRRGGYPAWGNVPGFNAPAPMMNPSDELSVLKAQADSLKASLDNIQKRMAELDNTSET